MKIDIEELRALPDYVKMTDWGISFPVLPTVGALGSFSSSDLNLRCETVDLPKPANQKMEINTRGHKVFQNGLADFGNSTTITFNDTVDNKIFNFVKAWREITRDFRTGKQFSKQDVQAVCVVTQYNPEGDAIRAWELVGCIYESDDFGSLDASSSDIARPSLTIGFDYPKPISLI